VIYKQHCGNKVNSLHKKVSTKRGGGANIYQSQRGAPQEHKKGLTNTDLQQGERVRTEAERLWSEVALPIADGTQTFNAGRLEAAGCTGCDNERTTVVEIKVSSDSLGITSPPGSPSQFALPIHYCGIHLSDSQPHGNPKKHDHD
jgi:hypothetical protein